ncbi:MAG: DnaA/Hda family protein, partial [Burkholderiaceae bacterium]
MLGADLWQRGCDRLAAELPEQQYNTWIRPLPPAVIAEAAEGATGPGLVISLRVPNRFKLDWIRNQYAGRIEAILSELAGRPARLELALAARDAAPAPAAQPANKPVALGQVLHNGLRPVNAPAAAPTVAPMQAAAPSAQSLASAASLAPAASRHRINTALTFDNLVPGRANQMARTAALHVAGAPGAMYNPLFIYGGVGLGKTHLIHAVGNALLRDKPDARVLYLHAEQFISDVVKNYQRKTFDELKAKYHSLDLLLIDDVQFFAGKDRTQEEFFNAFEALLAKRAHIIMTSDTYPKGLV